MTPPRKILVLCTGNSARSILAEYLLRHLGRGRFEVHSAGSKPTGRVNPFAVRVLRENYDLDADAARSKSWDELRATKFDFVITVCDNAREACPVWPGAPVVAHWSSPDPAGVEGTDEQKLASFVQVAAQIARRAALFCALPEEKLRDAAAVRAIGEQAKLANESAMKR
ncbi:MAG TPA: arsenate reductase ArsC [Opitutaceae bacterium]|nr:arsenate reductase ArsC [Opitutaceae bacterium]